MKTILLRNVTTGYRGKRGRAYVVTRRLDASLCSGELTCLLGANGAGKSTLLHTLSGSLPKLSGEVEVMGKEIEAYSDAELAKVVSVVLTEKCELLNMTVEETVALGRSPYTGFWGALRQEDKETVWRAMEGVGIAPLAYRMMQTLSDGEKQKVMIAKALAQETPIVFLDEPTAFLDFPSKVEMMLLLHRLSHAMRKTVFMSTHDLELALQLADKVWMVGAGDGVVAGTPEDLSLDGTLARFFSGKDIRFDPDTGLFKLNNECTAQVRLEGSGVRYAMARKALLRNGIWAGRDVESPVTVEATACPSPAFRICLPDGTVQEAADIAGLLREVDGWKASYSDNT